MQWDQRYESYLHYIKKQIWDCYIIYLKKKPVIISKNDVISSWQNKEVGNSLRKALKMYKY